MKIIQSPSPNFSKSSYKLEGVQIHKTLGNMPWTLQWMQNPKASASAHYLITKNGDIHQMVDLKDRPWSSGRIYKPSARALKIMKKTWTGKWLQPGHYLMQTEFECLLHEDLTKKQIESYVWLVKEVLDFEVTEDNFLEHQDTCSYKPEMEKERVKILELLAEDGTLISDGWARELTDIKVSKNLESSSNDELLNELKKRLKS